MAVEDRNLVFLHQELDAARELGRDLARALDHLLRVDGDLAFNLEAVGFGVLDVAVDLGRAQQRLGRDAAPVQADAAELVALDDGGLEAQLGRADRRGIAAGAGAEDDDVETGVAHVGSSPLTAAWSAGRRYSP